MSLKLTLHLSNTKSSCTIPVAEESVKAGFPSPAQDYLTDAIDLNKELIRHPSTTFYARVAGDSMINAGISEGDLLIVDKSITPKDQDVVVAYIDGEFTLKRIQFEEGKDHLWLMPENEKYSPIKINKENDFSVWGVVTYNIKKQSIR